MPAVTTRFTPVYGVTPDSPLCFLLEVDDVGLVFVAVLLRAEARVWKLLGDSHLCWEHRFAFSLIVAGTIACRPRCWSHSESESWLQACIPFA